MRDLETFIKSLSSGKLMQTYKCLKNTMLHTLHQLFALWHKSMLEAIVVQGCMNNFTFGDSNITYYETIAGGAGAGPGWVGRSGVHTHMTNTRITDPEILERRYPVVLHDFSLRKGSGGAGKYRGGDGVIREVSMSWL
jgi:N-methylhydantoinase B/oxoprolinase/acetone carboxylase alpha subunit